MSFAIATRLEHSDSAFEVFCVECRKSIGTMPGDILAAAIRHATGKGGVMCPDCRKRACRGCGWRLRAGEKGYCIFCMSEAAKRGSFLEMG